VGIAALDPAVLAAGAESLEAALDPFAGEPTLVVVANLADTDVACTSAALTALRQVAMLTVGVDAPSPLAPCFDLVVTADELPRVRAAFERSPRASVAAALLVRTPPPDIWTGLVAESATYSALQAGPEFIAWRRGRPVHPPSPHDDAPRVRLSDRDGVLEIVLTRPFKHNALDRRMRDELFEALLDWVEDGNAPVRIDLSSANGSVTMPICMYPLKATYKGSGSVTAASSYDCK